MTTQKVCDICGAVIPETVNMAHNDAAKEISEGIKALEAICFEQVDVIKRLGEDFIKAKAERDTLKEQRQNMENACLSWKERAESAERVWEITVKEKCELEKKLAKAQELLDKECEYCKLNGCDVEIQCPICLVPQAKAALGVDKSFRFNELDTTEDDKDPTKPDKTLHREGPRV